MHQLPVAFLGMPATPTFVSMYPVQDVYSGSTQNMYPTFLGAPVLEYVQICTYIPQDVYPPQGFIRDFELGGGDRIVPG